MRARLTAAALLCGACGTSGTFATNAANTGTGGTGGTPSTMGTPGSTSAGSIGASSGSATSASGATSSTSGAGGTAGGSAGGSKGSSSSGASSTSSGTSGATPTCTPGGDGGYAFAAYRNLSDYCLVGAVDGGLVPIGAGVLPYDLNTPFFSDYAIKVRTVWMPPGTSATYDPQNVFTFPNGTIFTKSFGWPDDARKANPTITWVETRVEMFVDGGWSLYPYLWNDAGTDATLSFGGQVVDVTFLNQDGGPLTADHLIPSTSQCGQCHSDNYVNIPIGPKARQLNGDFTYPDGVTANQLDVWTDAGILSGAPPSADAPVLPVWNDPDAGTLEQRARAYLEGNCAHCHNPNGYAASQGLDFTASDTTPIDYGVCAPANPNYFNVPGEGYILVPTDPANSLALFLLASTTTGELMPPNGFRSLQDVEGTGLVQSWIASFDGGGIDAGIDGGCGG